MLRHSAALLLVVAACSSPAGSQGQPVVAVPEQCRETIDIGCSRNADCSVETGETPAAGHATFVMNCKAGASTTLDCSRQTRVTGNPDACAMDLIAMPCSFYVVPTGLPLPASCRNLYAP